MSFRYNLSTKLLQLFPRILKVLLNVGIDVLSAVGRRMMNNHETEIDEVFVVERRVERWKFFRRDDFGNDSVKSIGEKVEEVITKLVWTEIKENFPD
jgi:hypothetical protein